MAKLKQKDQWMSWRPRVKRENVVVKKLKIASDEPLFDSHFVWFVHHSIFYKLSEEKTFNREGEPAELPHQKISLLVSFYFSTFFDQLRPLNVFSRMNEYKIGRNRLKLVEMVSPRCSGGDTVLKFWNWPEKLFNTNFEFFRVFLSTWSMF